MSVSKVMAAVSVCQFTCIQVGIRMLRSLPREGILHVWCNTSGHAKPSDEEFLKSVQRCLKSLVVHSPLQGYDCCLTSPLVTVQCLMMKSGQLDSKKHYLTSDLTSCSPWLERVCLGHHRPKCPGCYQPQSNLDNGQVATERKSVKSYMRGKIMYAHRYISVYMYLCV